MILIIDVDDVLLNWTKSFDKFVRVEYNYNGVYLIDNPQRLWEALGVDKSEIYEIMKHHNRLNSFADLEYYNDSEILINYIGLFDKVYCITSCGNTSKIMENRHANLVNRFHNFIDEYIFLDFLKPKFNKIDDIIHLHPNDEIYMLDDNVGDIEYAISIGVKGIVYKTAFHDSKDLPYVESMKEFIDSLK